MHIIKSKERLKETSVNDILYPKNENFFAQNLEPLSQDDRLKAMLLKKESEVKMVKGQERSNNDRKTYNDNIKNLDPRYTSLVPIGSIIVRFELIEDEFTDSGIILPKMAEVEIKKGNAVVEKTKDIFNFKKTAIIVAVPKQFTDLKPGTRIQYAHIRMLTIGDTVMGYEYEYTHPDYNFPNVPRVPTDPDFGYAILPTNFIKVIVSEPEI